MAIDLTHPVVRSPSATTAEIDGQLVALDITSGVCYGLNRVATRIWGMIDEPRTPDQLRDALLEVYEVEPEICEQQTLELLEELVRIGLVQRA